MSPTCGGLGPTWRKSSSSATKVRICSPTARSRSFAAFAAECGVTYNVHLPTDLSIDHRDGSHREQAVNAVLRAFERVAPLSPTTCTLHIPCNGHPLPVDDSERWRDRVQASLGKIVGAGVAPGLISVETLDYPLETLKELIDAFGLGVCLDVGHLILHGRDVENLRRI
ncbi:MAG: sugar phosphate isomerase/epimerase [Desulfobacterales bacterium]|nr:sugar phosphate isomerase/epimerase [Desulfobacterales bacterium]